MLRNLDLLETVNEAVNANTAYLVPTPYKWENSDENIVAGRPTGMCADQAIAKWERLVRAGWLEEHLRFAIVGVVEPGDHMILCARVEDNKWWALDIRFPRVTEPALLPYTWQKWGQDFNLASWTTVEWT